MINPEDVINLTDEFNKEHGTNYGFNDLLDMVSSPEYQRWVVKFVHRKYEEWGLIGDEREDH